MKKIMFVAVLAFTVGLSPVLVLGLTLDLDYSTYLGGVSLKKGMESAWGWTDRPT